MLVTSSLTPARRNHREVSLLLFRQRPSNFVVAATWNLRAVRQLAADQITKRGIELKAIAHPNRLSSLYPLRRALQTNKWRLSRSWVRDSYPYQIILCATRRYLGRPPISAVFVAHAAPQGLSGPARVRYGSFRSPSPQPRRSARKLLPIAPR